LLSLVKEGLKPFFYRKINKSKKALLSWIYGIY
jgi:hypothetical protein